MIIRNAFVALRVKCAERICDVVTGKRENAFVNHDNRDFAVCHRVAVIVFNIYRNIRFAAGRESFIGRFGGNGQFTRRGGNRKIQLSARKRRTFRQPERGRLVRA